MIWRSTRKNLHVWSVDDCLNLIMLVNLEYQSSVRNSARGAQGWYEIKSVKLILE